MADETISVLLDLQSNLNKKLMAAGHDVDKFGAKGKDLTKNMGKMQSSFGMAGKALAALGAVFVASKIAQSLKSITSQLIEMESGITKVSTLLDAKFKPALQNASREIVAMSVKTGKSTSDLNAALFDAVSSGFELDEAMQLMGASAKLAVGGFTDIKAATGASITVMQNYKEEVKGAADASDFLFAVQEKGRVTVEDVARTIGGVASTAANAKVPLEEMGAAYAAISRSGEGAEQTTTQLRAVIAALQTPQEAAIKQAKEWGVEIDINALRTKGLVGFLDQFNGMTGDQIALLFTESKAMRGMNTLLAQRGDLENILDGIVNRRGATETAMAKVTETLGFKQSQAAQTMKALALAFGEGIQPNLILFFDKLIEQLPDLFNNAKNLGRAFGDFIGTIDVALLVNLAEILAEIAAIMLDVVTATREGVSTLSSFVGLGGAKKGGGSAPAFGPGSAGFDDRVSGASEGPGAETSPVETMGDLEQKTNRFSEFMAAAKEQTLGLSNTFGAVNTAITDKMGDSWGIMGGLMKDITEGEMTDFGKVGIGAMNMLIGGSKLGSKSMKQLGTDMVGSIVSYVAQLVIGQGVALAVQATVSAASLAMASALAAAWAPVAAFVSLATFGANAAPASAGVSGVVALTAGLGQAASKLSVPGKALGGNVFAGSPVMVGEVGPELFVPDQSGTIVPHTTLKQQGGPGGMNITNNINIERADITSDKDVDKLADAIQERIGQTIEQRFLNPTSLG